MAKVTIEIEDTGSGVKITATPKFAELANIDNLGMETTPAQGYALRTMFTLYQLAKDDKQRGTQIIHIPKAIKLI